MSQKFLRAVICKKHGRVLPPPYMGLQKVVVVGNHKGKKDIGCPICRKESSQNQENGTHNE